MTARPAISAVASAVLLLALTAPVMTLTLGSGGIGMLPNDTDEKHAFDVIIDRFSDGVLTADIVVRASNVSAGSVINGVMP